ncbi:MAG: hypothetical protein ACPHN3_01460 [Spongiibacter sp.]
MKKPHLAVIVAGAFALATGCTNTHVANSEQIELQAQQQASATEITPEEALTQATELYTQATAQELMFYAPSHMEKARDKLDTARKILKKMETPEDKIAVTGAAFAAKKLVEDAHANKTKVETQLSRVLDHRKVLLELKTDTIHPKLYRKAVNKLEDLIRDIEGGLLAKAKDDEADVLEYYAEVEAETLKTTHLDIAIDKLDEAESIDADDFAEATFEKAEAAIEFAEDFIRKNYRDREGVVRVTHNAYVAAQRAYYVGQEAAKLVELNREKAEQYALYVESLLQTINEQANIPDLQSQSFMAQARALSKAISPPTASVVATPAPQPAAPAATQSQPTISWENANEE